MQTHDAIGQLYDCISLILSLCFSDPRPPYLQLRALLVLLGARGRQLLLNGGDRGRVFLLLVAQRLLVAQLGGLIWGGGQKNGEWWDWQSMGCGAGGRSE